MGGISRERSGDDLEVILRFFVGEIGKRHGFLKVVTVNQSGETGRQFGVKFSEIFFGRNRETTWNVESGHCKPIGRNRETVRGKIFRNIFSGETGKRHRILNVVTVNRSGENGRQSELSPKTPKPPIGGF